MFPGTGSRRTRAPCGRARPRRAGAARRSRHRRRRRRGSRSPRLATIARRMAAPRGEKPYRVYRGGRVKGKVPTIPRPTRERDADGDGRRDYRGPGPKRPAKGWRAWGWKRWTGLSILALFLLLFIWLLAAYLSFRGGVKAANKRLPESARLALVPDDGMMLSHA